MIPLPSPGMLFFAVSALSKLHNLPRKNLVNLGLAVLVIIVAVVLIKEAARMNRFVLFMIILVTVMVVGFSWVYERNEPKFLSPVIDQIAPFLPSRPRY
jgi:EamA domain-containing membrane protein RarD